MTNNKYNSRIIKDLAVTFNFTPVSIAELARYWKRSMQDVQAAAEFLQMKQVLNINKRQELSLTSDYKKFFKRNPDLALSVARTGF